MYRTPSSSTAISGSKSSPCIASLRFSQQLPKSPPSPCAAITNLPTVALLGRLGELFRFGDSLLDGTHHVERLLWQVIVFAGAQTFEAFDRVGEVHELARRTGEHLRHMEGLRQEALDFAGA